MDLQSIKTRYGIIGNDPKLNRAIEVAVQVAATDLTVMINGESGTGKDVIPRIIHDNSARKHGKYMAINCGAIPEGTIDSELFGHEKGSFTGAVSDRKGYFEEADGGTLFLDEVGELPMATQARLLRVLENGEFIKVGSSKVQKTNVRVIAATNVDIPAAIERGKFREDLYYRLNTMPIKIPALRERKGDIRVLFLKFSLDAAARTHKPALKLTEKAMMMMENYHWEGNIRQMKNIVDQMSLIEENRIVDETVVAEYLPRLKMNSMPALFRHDDEQDISERDIMYKFLFDMKRDIAELRKTVAELKNGGVGQHNIGLIPQQTPVSQSISHNGLYEIIQDKEDIEPAEAKVVTEEENNVVSVNENVAGYETLSLIKNEKDFIIKALAKHGGKRRDAAKELGISERTLYRKINEYGI